jgi:hypothetical protein
MIRNTPGGLSARISHSMTRSHFGHQRVVKARICEAQPNKRLKLAARVDYGMNRSSARRSLSAIR